TQRHRGDMISDPDQLRINWDRYVGHNIACIAVDGNGEIIDFDFNHNHFFRSSAEHRNRAWCDACSVSPISLTAGKPARIGNQANASVTNRMLFRSVTSRSTPRWNPVPSARA